MSSNTPRPYHPGWGQPPQSVPSWSQHPLPPGWGQAPAGPPPKEPWSRGKRVAVGAGVIVGGLILVAAVGKNPPADSTTAVGSVSTASHSPTPKAAVPVPAPHATSSPPTVTAPSAPIAAPTPSDDPTNGVAKTTDYLFSVDQQRHPRSDDQQLTQALADRCTDVPLTLAFAATVTSVDVMGSADHSDVYNVLNRLRADLPAAGPKVDCQPKLDQVKAEMAPPSPAQPATTVPNNGATALCADGTLSYSAHHQGTCSHHGGVSVWYK